MNTIQYAPVAPNFPRLIKCIDKLKIAMPHEYLNSIIKTQYQTGSITIMETGEHAFISFHAECLYFDQPLLRQIAYHLYELARYQVFVPWISSVIMRTLNMVKFPVNANESAVLDCLSNIFTISEIELAFDFEGVVPWQILDWSKFNVVCRTTYYSNRDYQKEKRKGKNSVKPYYINQKSLVCIYDHALCHEYDGTVTRFELRFCGTYAEKWNFLKLTRPLDDILSRYYNLIAGSLHKAIKPSDIKFDMASIQQTHPQFATILERWASWGK